MKLLIYISFIFLMISSRECYAQLFNYDPIRHSSFETNPAYLAAGQSKNMVSLIHQGGLPWKDGFAYDEVKYSCYLPKHFCGAGVVLNNTQVNDSVAYRYVALGAAYRNVLLGVIHTRLGVLYKYNQFLCKGVRLKDYGVEHNEGLNPATLHNANVSVSFSSYRESVFVSFALLNMQFAGNEREFAAVSPTYYVINAGDLAKLFWWEETSISFSAYLQQHDKGNHAAYFVHIKQKGLAITRRSQLFYQLNTGYHSSGYLQVRPSLSLAFFSSRGYHRRRKVEKNSFNVLFDFSVPLENKVRPYTPGWQFSFTHFF